MLINQLINPSINTIAVSSRALILQMIVAAKKVYSASYNGFRHILDAPSTAPIYLREGRDRLLLRKNQSAPPKKKSLRNACQTGAGGAHGERGLPLLLLLPVLVEPFFIFLFRAIKETTARRYSRPLPDRGFSEASNNIALPFANPTSRYSTIIASDGLVRYPCPLPKRIKR